MWRDIKRILAERNHFIITTHINPDGDGMGAACALTGLLRKLGKESWVVCDSPIPDKYRFLDFHRTFYEYDQAESLLENAQV